MGRRLPVRLREPGAPLTARVRFAPSPTGSLHVGNALVAVINRGFGSTFLLRIDDTDPARNVPGGEEAILRDLEWLGIAWDEGPLRQSERQERYREAAAELVARGAAAEEGAAVRLAAAERPTLLREDGTATYQLASPVDDLDHGVTHVIRGKDLEARVPAQEAIARALGGKPPEFVHHGLILGPDGHKLSKRDPLASVAELRDAGIPAEAVREYLEGLGIPRGDVHYDVKRIRRLAIEAIAALSDEDLAERTGAPLELVPALRGARDLSEARETAGYLLEPAQASLPEAARPTFDRLRELLAGDLDGKSVVRELKAVGGDLKAVRLALTGRERGPELASVISVLSREEALRRIDAATLS